MAVVVTPAVVLTETGATVTAGHIATASSFIEERTGYTPDEHESVRSIGNAAIVTAWSMIAARVMRRVTGDGDVAVIGESQGDYTYTESETLARHARFADLLDGLPSELLCIEQTGWRHV